jgi:hypothetical protein
VELDAGRATGGAGRGRWVRDAATPPNKTQVRAALGGQHGGPVDTALSEAVGRGWLTVTERGRSQLLTLSDTGTARLALEAR